jgi:predicted AAA+ superfamily ATPase
LRTSPKVNFTDQSLAIAILNASPQKLLDDIRTLGFMFESYVLKHLNVYCSLSDTKIYFYRDSDDCEIDCIIENKDNE